ncbi:hypothetical protein MNEG_5712 [Monoraphidium neglectum]|uniref:Uncharacterized protein n=1 Tax=Monoraphidium neglectum TaxID=145388 RepID=A0A0D2N997_9CHLO|nr:hypothetical protein MNEG_5712 [Monoraphidium neglectum]KIZ02251.1 hypothetical protein MNEG_5712 [Monoraphidium neglectum]|eukprot:XP_013901270.1 hypothetical protein MNEG_5712 [Monoraphidium neglectum]
MQHPSDAAEVALTSIVDIASQQQLAIGKREAREQAAALATASEEIRRWKAVADEALAAKARLLERSRELEVQRDESMSINRELLAGYKRVAGELQEASGKVRGYEEQLVALRQQLLDLRSALTSPEAVGDGGSGNGAGPGGDGNGKPWWNVLGGTGGGAAGGSGRKEGGGGEASGAAGAAQAVLQLLQISGQLAREAERDDERRAFFNARTQTPAFPPLGTNGRGAGGGGGGDGESDGSGGGGGGAAGPGEGRAAVGGGGLSPEDA